MFACDTRRMTPNFSAPRGKRGFVQFQSTTNVPTKVGSQSVDDMNSEEDGVWHPSGLCLWWQGTNPFALPSLKPTCLRDIYTEELRSAASVQWAMPVDDRCKIDHARSNRASATQPDRPDWLTAPEYQLFCSVRAYPRMQIRKICVALRDRGLPFARREVQTLVKQALYHVGELHGNDDEVRQPCPRANFHAMITTTLPPIVLHIIDNQPRSHTPTCTQWSLTRCERSTLFHFESHSHSLYPPLYALQPTVLRWKHEDVIVGSCYDALVHELISLADELQDRISEHASLLVMIDVCSYLLGFTAPNAQAAQLVAVRRRCVAISEKWFAEREAQIMDPSTDQKAVPSLRADQCVFTMYGILAHGGSSLLHDDDHTKLCSLLFRSAVRLVYKVDKEEELDRQVMEALHERCRFVAATRSASLTTAMKKNNHALTSALQSVLPEAPDELEWTQLHTACGASASFEAISSTSQAVHLYVVSFVFSNSVVGVNIYLCCAHSLSLYK